MRTFLLKIKADLENCTDLEPLDHEDYPHDYGFMFSCGRCKYKHPREILLNRYEPCDVDLKGFRRKAHFQIKCKDCHNVIFVILKKPDTKLTLQQSKEDQFVPVLEIHSHGCIITDFVLEDQFQCKSLTGETFEGVDLRRNEWSDFDEKNNVPITVTNFSYEIETLAGNGTMSSL